VESAKKLHVGHRALTVSPAIFYLSAGDGEQPVCLASPRQLQSPQKFAQPRLTFGPDRRILEKPGELGVALKTSATWPAARFRLSGRLKDALCLNWPSDLHDGPTFTSPLFTEAAAGKKHVRPACARRLFSIVQWFVECSSIPTIPTPVSRILADLTTKSHFCGRINRPAASKY
jgi:hypothetical protein